VLGRKVVEGEQAVGVASDLGDGSWPLDAELAGERVDRPLGVGAVLGGEDLVQGSPGGLMDAGRERAEHISSLMHPAVLLAGVGEDRPQPSPQAQRAVTDHDHRRTHPAAAQIPQQLLPVLGGLPGALGDRDQFLDAIRTDPDDHQRAQPAVGQPQGEVDPVGPAVHVVDLRQVPLRERRMLGLPLLDQPPHRRGRQPGGRPEELGERGHEIAGGQPVQVQQRQDLGDLRTPAHPARQDRAGEPDPLAALWVGAPVVHPGPGDLHGAGTHRQGPRRGVPVAHHQPVTALVDLALVGGEISVDLGLQRMGEHPPGTLTRQLVQVQAQPGLLGQGVGDYTQHAAFLPRRRWPAGVLRSLHGWKVRRALMLGSIHKIQV
jgi:hypothetical protein